MLVPWDKVPAGARSWAIRPHPRERRRGLEKGLEKANATHRIQYLYLGACTPSDVHLLLYQLFVPGKQWLMKGKLVLP